MEVIALKIGQRDILECQRVRHIMGDDDIHANLFGVSKDSRAAWKYAMVSCPKFSEKTNLSIPAPPVMTSSAELLTTVLAVPVMGAARSANTRTARPKSPIFSQVFVAGNGRWTVSSDSSWVPTRKLCSAQSGQRLLLADACCIP